MTTLSILVGVCILVNVGFYKPKAHGALIARLSFPLQFMVELLCSCLYLLDAIFELDAMDEKSLLTLLLENKAEFIYNKQILDLRHIFCIYSGDIYYNNLKKKCINTRVHFIVCH